MLTMADYARLENEISRIYESVETDLIMKVVRVLHSQTRTLSVDDWKLRKLSGMGVLEKDLNKLLKRKMTTATPEIEAAIRDMCEASDQFDVRILEKIKTFAERRGNILTLNLIASEAQEQRFRAVILNARDSINLTNTRAVQATVEAYRTAINQAYIGTLEGAETLDNAVRKACYRLGGSGLKLTYYNSSGQLSQVISLDAGIRRNVVTSVAQATAQNTLSRCSENGVKLVQVSAHAGARPEHALWQGKVYSLNGATDKYDDFYSATDYGSATGLCGCNCRHHFFPYYEGMTKTDWGIDLDARANEELYNDLQRQRYNERQIRSWKRTALVARETGDSSGFEKASAKVKEWQAKQREWCEEKDLVRRYARERI